MSVYKCYCDKCNVPDNVKYNRKNRKSWESSLENIFSEAIHHKKYDCVNNICEEENCKITNSVANVLASYGDLDGLKFLRSKKMKFGTSVLCSAIDRDNVDCIKYLQSQKCKWTKATTKYAARRGKINVLTYMVEQGCPCDEEACYWAAKNRHWNCVQFLCDHGCLFNVIHATEEQYESDYSSDE